MSVVGYMLKRMRKININRFKKHMSIIAKNNNRSKLFVEFDFLKNFLVYGCSYTDYFRGDYINLTKEQKKTYVTAKSFYKILHYFNEEEDKKYLSNKLLFNEKFKKYLKRDYIDIGKSSFEEFEKFISDKEIVFAKVIEGFGGHGIKKVILKDYEDKKALFDELISNEQLLVEEAIIQSDDINEINPYSVSSFRIVTLYKDGKAYVLNNSLRVNQDNNEVIGCTNDLYFSLSSDGKISSNVIDDYANIYNEHPLTKKKFKDVVIHGVDEAFEMCKEAALLLPKERYIGWDVGFTKNGPCIIEGNEFPGYGIIQFYKLNGSKEGHLQEIKNICGDEAFFK